MTFSKSKCDWCHNWENCGCDKKVLNPCSPFNCNLFEDFNNYFKELMKSKRKVKLLLQIHKKTNVIQGKICAVTDDTIFIIEDKCSVPTSISISIIKHVMPL